MNNTAKPTKPTKKSTALALELMGLDTPTAPVYSALAQQLANDSSDSSSDSSSSNSNSSNSSSSSSSSSEESDCS
jgi:hypothetical protein